MLDTQNPLGVGSVPPPLKSCGPWLQLLILLEAQVWGQVDGWEACVWSHILPPLRGDRWGLLPRAAPCFLDE